ncbi:MAG: AtpZ/AtpI family protein, partial [Chloroflexi bacterium]|nr:AtpZ/AtpI family protein [Chloroflexota bacterium]
MVQKPVPPDGEDSSKASSRKALQETAVLLARISGIGWYVVGSIGAGTALGWWLDKQFGTTPVLLLIGLVLGVIAAFAG